MTKRIPLPLCTVLCRLDRDRRVNLIRELFYSIVRTRAECDECDNVAGTGFLQRNNYIPHELTIIETRLRKLCARSTVTRCPESIAITPFRDYDAVYWAMFRPWPIQRGLHAVSPVGMRHRHPRASPVTVT